MAQGCGPSVAKYTLFFFNFLFFVVGGGLMGVGIWMRVDPKSVEFSRIVTVSASDPLLQTAAILIAVVGGIIFIVAFLGCFGACSENPCMLLTYTVIVSVLAVGQIVAGVLAAVFSSKVEGYLKGSMSGAMSKYDRNSAVSKAWDAMQIWLECCGVDNRANWQAKSQANNTWLAFHPPSCCQLKDPDPNKLTATNMKDNPSCATGSAGYNTKGCYNSLRGWMRRHIAILIGCAFGLIIIEILVAVLACCLRHSIKNDPNKFV